MIKGNYGRLITESKEVLRIWAALGGILQGATEQKRGSKDRKKWKQQCIR